MNIADYNSATVRLKAFVKDARAERYRRNPSQRTYQGALDLFLDAAKAVWEFAAAVRALNHDSRKPPPFPVGGITHQGEELIIDKKGNVIK